MTFIMCFYKTSFNTVLNNLIFPELKFNYNVGCLNYIFAAILGTFWTTGLNFWQWGHNLFFDAYLVIFLNKTSLAI